MKFVQWRWRTLSKEQLSNEIWTFDPCHDPQAWG